jgi:hypothetical protein
MSDSPVSNPTVEASKPPRFTPGGPAGPGRPKGGGKARRAVRLEALYNLIEFGEKAKRRKHKTALKARAERWKDLLTDPDGQVRLAAERYLMDRDFGRAKIELDVTHRSEVVEDASARMKEFQRGLILPAGNGNGAHPEQPN